MFRVLAAPKKVSSLNWSASNFSVGGSFLILSLANLTFFLNKKLRHSVALVIWKGVTFFLIKKTIGKS
jgi:hypothetical protein